MKPQEVMEKLLNGVELSEEEVTWIWMYGFMEMKQVAELEGDARRWSRVVTHIYEVDGRYFSVWFDIGLTECQEDWYPAQTAIEVEGRVEERLIKIIQYINKQTGEPIK